MKGSLFTEKLTTNLPTDIQTFISNQNLKVLFKHDLPLLFNKELREKSLNPSTVTEQEQQRLKTKRSDKLESILRSSCNPKFTKSEREQYLKNNSCKKYYDEKNQNMKDRGKSLDEPLMYLPGIGDDYFENITKSFESPSYDIVVVVNTDNNKARMDQSVVAFLTTEQSECKDAENVYTDIPALKLICVSSRNRSKYTSRVLMYLYLYALKQSNYKYGLLELAGSYCNLAGLCLYNKFGFREDISIKTKTCFPEAGTLTMVADLETISYESLGVALTSEKSENVELPDSEPLCKKEENPKTSEEKQRRMEDQQNKVKMRMENYDNILSLQNGEINLDTMEDIYFDNKKPTDLKKAIKDLSRYSKQGSKIMSIQKTAIPDYFMDDNEVSTSKTSISKNGGRRRLKESTFTHTKKRKRSRIKKKKSRKRR